MPFLYGCAREPLSQRTAAVHVFGDGEPTVVVVVAVVVVYVVSVVVGRMRAILQNKKKTILDLAFKYVGRITCRAIFFWLSTKRRHRHMMLEKLILIFVCF